MIAVHIYADPLAGIVERLAQTQRGLASESALDERLALGSVAAAVVDDGFLGQPGPIRVPAVVLHSRPLDRRLSVR